MVWSKTLIGTPESAAFAADEPAFITNTLARAVAVNWYNAALSATINNSLAPPRYAIDMFGGSLTSPDITGAPTEVNLVFQIPSDNDIDSIVILNHNFDACGITFFNIELADALTFIGPDVLVSYASAPSDNSRIIWYDDNRTTGATFVRIKLQASGGFSTAPYIGQVICGKRVQLSAQPDDPWHPDRARTTAQLDEADSGAYTWRSTGVGLIEHQPQWEPSDCPTSSPYSGMNDGDAFKELFRLTKGFDVPFCVCYTPTSTPEDTIWVKDVQMQLDLEYGEAGSKVKRQELDYRELPPGLNFEKHWQGW